jgi:hypothetical protein
MVMASIAQPADLLLWHNLVFVGIFGLGFLFTLLQLIGLGSDADVDVGGADADVDVDVDADVHLGGDVAAEMDADADMHLEHDHHFGLTSTAAQLLGLGKIPLSISLMLLCYTVGLAGWISNVLLGDQIGSPVALFPVSMLIALMAGFLVLRLMTGLMARYLPPSASTAIDPRQLVGSVAKATLPVDERIGQAMLYDRHGTLQMVRCRVADGAKPIAKGEQVVLVKYLSDRRMYVVGRA